MKVFYLTVATLPSSTAHAAYVLNLAAALALQGVDVRVGACRGKGRIAVPKRDRFSRNSVAVTTFPVIRRSPTFRILSLTAIALTPAVRYEPGCIVIVHNPIVALTLIIRRISFVYDFHGLPPRGRLLRRILQSRSLLGCMFNSRQMEFGVREMFGDIPRPTLVLGSGVWDDFFSSIPPKSQARKKLGIPADATVIGYIGSLGENRGIDLLLRSALVLRKHSQQLFWLFVGGAHEHVKRWKNLARILGLDPKTYRFVGHQPQDALPNWYATTDMLCAPYSSKLSSISVMAPMKLLEYAATGKPIIVSDFPTTREALEGIRHAVFTRPDSVTSFSNAILNVIENSSGGISHAMHIQDQAFPRHTWEEKSSLLKNWLANFMRSETEHHGFTRR